MRRIYIQTFGCQMNEADSAELRDMLLTLGLVEARSPREADLVLVNTCSVRKKAEDKAKSFIGQLRRWRAKRPERRLAVLGCMAARDPEGIRERFPFVDAVIPGKDLEQMKAEVRALLPEDLALLPHLQGYSAPRIIGMVSVIRGCNNACSFCVVPYVRGREVSLPPEQVLRRVGELLDHGVAEIYLLGQSILDYGKDLEPPVPLEDLMAQIVARYPTLKRLRFLTSHPKDLTERFVRTVRDLQPTVTPYFHIPFQAGSNRILELMRRDITIEEYYEKIAMIRELIPEASISTDIIVGFPTETEEDFAQTLEVVRRVRFDGAFVFKYSPRPHTLANLKWGDPVPPEVKARRFETLYALVREVVYERNRSQVGKEGVVLVEGQEDGRLYGRLADYRMTHLPGPTSWIGQLVRVRITGAHPWHLDAEPLHQEAAVPA